MVRSESLVKLVSVFFITENSRPSSLDLIPAQQTLLSQAFTDEPVRQICSCCVPAQAEYPAAARDQPQAVASVSLLALPVLTRFPVEIFVMWVLNTS